ncbi:migration and invasion enhancer 1-like [Rhagoletis pomonella]|uniref:migration and invasion enhancer 1-like n=1 Tax=Rhagoletis pomonella TaxID=28610 RepID=UPI00177DE6FD|nr:migration and invasion enhancer 1-like [Rhagoletis pomonella]
MVKVNVEYCPKCNFEWQCKMLENFLLQQQPETEVVCFKGRQGSFEVKIDDNLVHSKLQSLAFPDHESVLENVRKAEKGLPVEKVKEQPIDNCMLM